MGGGTLGPERRVVKDFCLDVTEVTASAYAACVRAGKCTEPGRDLYGTYGVAGKETHPVNYVDWDQAVAYCQWMGKRLPTQEEWWWAAQGGETGTRFPWGNESPGAQLCWDGEGNDKGKMRRAGTCPVGSYPRGDSPQGAKDLEGNVSEWTSTPVGSGAARVCVGSSWSTRKTLAASYVFPPSDRYDFLGFRCAATP